jgi:hypothetical protein
MNFPDLHLNWERTKTIAAATSNTWGLFVLVSCENRNRLKFKLKLKHSFLIITYLKE